MFGCAGLLLVLGLIGVNSDQTIICEHSTGNIWCPAWKAIQINGANYGRTHFNPCPHESRSNLNCVSGPSVQNKVASRCDGLRACSITARNSEYGDTCYGTFKYLNVTYECVETRVSVTCEHDTARLACGGNQQIHIESVNYGRTDQTTCHHSLMRNFNCYSGAGADDVVRSSCEGRNSCSVSVTNGNMRGDPCYGTFKYLRVVYDCV